MAEPTAAATAAPAALPHPTEPVKTRVIYAMTLIEFVVTGALIAPLIVLLSLKVLALDPAIGKEFALSIVTVVGALATLVVTPVFGHLSDRTVSRFGRRRPWIVAGVIAGAPALVLVATAGDLVTLAIGWGLAQLSYAATLAALYGMLSDRVPDGQRAKASGIFGAGAFAGMVPALIVAGMLKDELVLAFTVMPAVALVVTLATVPFLSDAPTTRAQVGSVHLRGVFGALVFNPVRMPQFAWVWLQRFSMQFGYMIMGTFGLFYLLSRLQMDTDAATTTTSIASLLVAFLSLVAAFTGGYLASRKGDYTPFVMTAILVLAAACLLKAFTASLAMFWIGNVLAGFALGTYYAVDLALVMRTIPAAEAGRYLGVFNIAKTLPQSLAPAVAPFFLLIGGNVDPLSGGEGNYLALYLVAGLVVLASMLPLRRITALRPGVVVPGVTPIPLPDAAVAAGAVSDASPEPVPVAAPVP